LAFLNINILLTFEIVLVFNKVFNTVFKTIFRFVSKN